MLRKDILHITTMQSGFWPSFSPACHTPTICNTTGMVQEKLNQQGTTLAQLLKLKAFPALPEKWVASVEAVTWHNKVVRTFDELKSMDLDSFRTTCA
jgi:hypothetical protein